MVPRLKASIFVSLLFFIGLTSGIELKCSNFDDKLIEDSCRSNQDSLPGKDRANLNFQLLNDLSDKNSRELVKDYNQDIPSIYFDKYAVDAESFYIDEAWVYIRNPFRTVRIENKNLVSPSKGNIEIKTGYETNERAEEGFIDIDNSPGSCSNQAKLLDVEEELKTNFSTPLNNGKLAYSLNKSAVIKARYKLKTELQIKDRDLVCTGDKKCKLECQSVGYTTTIEEEIFTDKREINIAEIDSKDFFVGETGSKTVFKVNNLDNYLEINFSFSEDRLYLKKKAQEFRKAQNDRRFYPVYLERFQTKKISNSSIRVRENNQGRLLINESVGNECSIDSQTLSLNRGENLECNVSSTELINNGLKDRMRVGEVKTLSYFVIPLVMFSWVYWYM